MQFGKKVHTLEIKSRAAPCMCVNVCACPSFCTCARTVDGTTGGCRLSAGAVEVGVGWRVAGALGVQQQ